MKHSMYIRIFLPTVWAYDDKNQNFAIFSYSSEILRKLSDLSEFSSINSNQVVSSPGVERFSYFPTAYLRCFGECEEMQLTRINMRDDNSRIVETTFAKYSIKISLKATFASPYASSLHNSPDDWGSAMRRERASEREREKGYTTTIIIFI